MSSSWALLSLLGGRGRHRNWKNDSLGSLETPEFHSKNFSSSAHMLAQHVNM